MNADELRALLLSFIGSLTLADHMGDVARDVDEVLKRLGFDTDDPTFEEDWRETAVRVIGPGVTTLYGTSLADEAEG